MIENTHLRIGHVEHKNVFLEVQMLGAKYLTCNKGYLNVGKNNSMTVYSSTSPPLHHPETVLFGLPSPSLCTESLHVPIANSNHSNLFAIINVTTHYPLGSVPCTASVFTAFQN